MNTKPSNNPRPSVDVHEDWKDPEQDPAIIEALRHALRERQVSSVVGVPEQGLPEAHRHELASRRPGFADRIIASAAEKWKAEPGAPRPAEPEELSVSSIALAGGRRSTEGVAALRETVQIPRPQGEAPIHEVYESQPSTRQLDIPAANDQYLSLLRENFGEILRRTRLNEPYAFPFWEPLGAGAQGVVFETRCAGADGFCLRAALKLISPEKYHTAASYDDDARRLAQVCSKIAWPRDGNIMGVSGFWCHRGIRMMLMELVDGYDLERLFRHAFMEQLQNRLGEREWRKYQEIVVTPTPDRPQLKPFVAVGIIRQCLAGLSSLDERSVVHGDIKPENIMLQRNGQAKIIDFGSAFELGSPPPWFFYTPAYAAVETLERRERTRQSDLASLGYVLIEVLAGKRLFAGHRDPKILIELKRALPDRLEQDILPPHVRCNRRLVNFCQRLIDPDLTRRFGSPSEADLHPRDGAAEVQRQLVQANLSLVVENEVHRWIDAVKPKS